MKMKKISVFVLTFMLLVSFRGFSQTHWKIDNSHSDIGFTVTHMAISEVDGKFTEFTGEVVGESKDFDGSSVEF